MGKFPRDLTGVRFGRWTVLYKLPSVSKNSRWYCRCECGNESIVERVSLVQGNSKSCGCYNLECLHGRRRHFEGRTYGRLTVLYRNGESRNRATIWHCLCDCGKEIDVLGTNLTSGCTTSCGCYALEQRKILNTKHGLTGTREYEHIKNNKRRERKNKLDSGWTKEMEMEIRKFFDKCAICGSREKLATDHVLPLSAGFGLIPGNAIRLCKTCNSHKGHKLLDDLEDSDRAKVEKSAMDFLNYWRNIINVSQ